MIELRCSMAARPSGNGPSVHPVSSWRQGERHQARAAGGDTVERRPHALENRGIGFGRAEVQPRACNDRSLVSHELNQRTTSGRSSLVSCCWISGTAVTQSSDHEKALPWSSSENASVAPQPGIAAPATAAPRRRCRGLESRNEAGSDRVSDDADHLGRRELPMSWAIGRGGSSLCSRSGSVARRSTR